MSLPGTALFERALIVEDLDEPREWLAELLPRALPSIAARVLRHFHEAPPARSAAAPQPLAPLLGLSSHTVTGCVRDVYRKLGISSRAEATLEAARCGLVA